MASASFVGLRGCPAATILLTVVLVLLHKGLHVGGRDQPNRVAQLTLHLGASTAAKWLMPRMDDFARRFSRISFRTEVYTRQLSRHLARNEIAIWPGKISDRKPFKNGRLLTGIRLVAVCSPDFRRPDWPMDVDTLLTLPLLQDSHRQWEALIEATGHCARHKLLNFDRSALALDAAIEGHGVAMVPSYMVAGDVNRNRLVEVWVSPEELTEHLFVSWSIDDVRQPDVRRIVDWIASEFTPKRTFESS